jgi:hypothetical protein
MDILIDAARNGATRDVNESALRCIHNFALAAGNRIPMYQRPGLMDLLQDVAETGTEAYEDSPPKECLMMEFSQAGPNRLEEDTIDCLQNLAVAEENQVPMYRRPGMMDLLQNAAKNGATDPIKANAINCLLNLANAKENAISMHH